ncbi:MAG: hypothetical protein CFE31_09840 [Rhizobiales bacterium PAR1]|nr:MAG: hypothetical protein CFE31_09840 [Rhizobiales bacterium PAR1]
MTAPLLIAPRPSDDWQAMARRAHFVLAGGFGVFMLWASLAKIESAAIAPGIIASESNRKTIQHLEGGIVQEILVRDGQHVGANDLLVRLDPTRVDSQGDLYKNQYAIALAQEARLLAEFNGQDDIKWPTEVLDREHEAAVAPVVADQKRLFTARRTALVRNTGIADSQVEQIRRDIEQSRSDIEIARATLVQVDEEYNGLLPLYRQKLVPTTRMAPLERERIRLKGVVEGGEINIRKLKERLEELLLRRQQVVQDARQEASTQLLDVRKQLSDLRQQMLLSTDLQKRAEIRAPIAGTVQQMRFFTVGGVIRPGEPILDIAPENDDLVVKAKVSPNDIDRVSVGSKAEISFPSLHYWGAEAVYGTVRAISRDRVTEENTKTEPYFATELVVDRTTLPENIRGKMIAGLEANVLVLTGERTVLGYLLKPILERTSKAMRER